MSLNCRKVGRTLSSRRRAADRGPQRRRVLRRGGGSAARGGEARWGVVDGALLITERRRYRPSGGAWHHRDRLFATGPRVDTRRAAAAVAAVDCARRRMRSAPSAARQWRTYTGDFHCRRGARERRRLRRRALSRGVIKPLRTEAEDRRLAHITLERSIASYRRLRGL